MVMSPDKGGVYSVLARLARFGLGGPHAGGLQYISWIHGEDFVRAVLFLLEREDLEGAVKLAAPGPLPQRDFMSALRDAVRQPLALPAAKWMLEVGAFFLRTDTKLLLKSRRVLPARLEEAGFAFSFPTWPEAAAQLADVTSGRQNLRSCGAGKATSDSQPPRIGA